MQGREESGPVQLVGEALFLRVRAIPNAGRSGIVGVRAGELVVKVQAPALEGRANRELVRLLASHLGVPRSSVELVGGESSHHKRLRLPSESGGAVRALCEVSD